MPLRMRVHDREPIGMALRRFKKLIERSGMQKATARMKAAVLTVSDGVAAGEREDESGEVLAGLLAEDGYEVASVRFWGLLREEPGANPESFDEIWHVRRKAGTRDSWLIAGIQQTANS